MKKLFVIAALLCSFATFSDAQSVVVNKADGNKIVLPSKKVNSITTSTNNDAESLDYYSKSEADNLHSEMKGYLKAYTDDAAAANQSKITTLDGKLSSQETTIAQLKTTIEELKAKNSELSATNAELQSQIQTLTSLLTALQADVDKLNKFVDTHEYVDLGLPSGTLWATCNIGANSPEEYGDYFAWGETKPQGGNKYAWESYKWCNGSENTMTKYCTDINSGTIDDKAELGTSDDAAYVNWGPDWRMPSINQINELTNSSYTTAKWTTQNGVTGSLITSKTNGNSIFMPAAGSYCDSFFYNGGSYGNYWSRSLYHEFSYDAYSINVFSSLTGVGPNYRCYGQSIRPVRIQ